MAYRAVRHTDIGWQKVTEDTWPRSSTNGESMKCMQLMLPLRQCTFCTGSCRGPVCIPPYCPADSAHLLSDKVCEMCCEEPIDFNLRQRGQVQSRYGRPCFCTNASEHNKLEC